MRRELLLLLDLGLVERALRLGRADDDIAAAAVEDDLVAVLNEVDLVADAEYRWDRTRLGDDDNMARCTAGAEDHARDLLGGHACHDGRLDLLTAEDDLPRADLRLLDTEDVFGDALAHVAQIDRARGEVLVLHLLEDLCLFVRSVEDALRCAAARLDFALDVLRHHRILHHHAVRLKNGGLFCLLLSPQSLDGREEVFGDSDECCLRLALLFCSGARMIRREIAVEVLPCEQGLTDGDPGDHAFSTDWF